MNINEKLFESIFNGDLEQVKECLVQGADMNYNNGKHYSQYYSTTLIESAHKGHLEHLEIAKLLIQHGADVNSKDCNGWNPLMVAVNRGYMSDPNKQSLEFAKLLIDNGADVNAKNNNGKTALDYAKKTKNSLFAKIQNAN